jgi:uncharacterized protein YraI
MRSHMATSIAILLGLAVLGAAAEPAAVPPRKFPYKARVTANNVYVRSGPGNNYYPTEKVHAGTQLEVHRHDAGGWCAIRPPDGSFSWVPGRHLKPGEENLAEVTSDRVPVGVGSRFSDIRHATHVRLDRGELVAVLGKKEIDLGSGAETWYRISPPSGEFRWVLTSYLDPLPEKAPGAGSGAVANGPGAASPGATGGSSSGVEGSSAAAGPAPGPLPAGRALSSADFQAELDDVNSQLSIMLAEEPTVWNCQELSRRTQALADRAQTAEERGRARLLTNRLAQAEDIQRRFETAGAGRLETERRSEPSSELARGGASIAGVPREDDRFDGAGRLTRVVPPKLGAPRYAIVDDRGQVRCFVTPAPGINMSYYLGRRVGINGVRTSVPDRQGDILTAKHITPLDSPLR